LNEGDKMAGRHGNKGVISLVVPEEDMPFLEDGTPVDIILNPLGVPGRMNIGQVLEAHLGWAASRLGFRAVTPVFDGASEAEIEAALARAWLMDWCWRETGHRAWEWLRANDYDPESILDDYEAAALYLRASLGDEFDADLLATDLNYARRAALASRLVEMGYEPDKVLVFEDDHRTEEEQAECDSQAVAVCLETWLRENGSRSRARSLDGLKARANEVTKDTGNPNPTLGKMVLRDGKTGERFDQPVTIGMIHMMKLAHLVEDKVHARSTGPYSLVTQQPLGGKAQFGGQRFGEMEVWALEAYGAAHTLQEMLTVKSDDVVGRVKAYEDIIKGDEIEAPSIPASFRVLVKEMQSLGLKVGATPIIILAKLDYVPSISRRIHLKAETLHLLYQYTERCRYTGSLYFIALDNILVCFNSPHYIIRFHRQHLLQRMSSAISLQSPYFHFPKTLPSKLRFAT
jgi:DNA-directed RNA polymerase subunit beta